LNLFKIKVRAIYLKKVIITGATGMIGIALMEILIKRDIEVISIVRPDSAKIKNIPKSDKIEVIECEISNLLSLSSIISKDCDAFFHFGWAGTLGVDRNDTYLQYSNIQYTLDAVKLASEKNCKVFVGAGSQAEYGKTEEKMSCNTSINPESAYGVSKYAAGMLSKILCDELNIRHVWGRILSVYGPGDNDSTLVMSCINSFIKNEKLSTTKGDQLWDYIYSEDCANAFFLMAKNGQHGEIYCVGSGKAIPLKEYMIEIRDIINPSCPIGLGEIEYAPNQVMNLCADISKLSEHTGFETQVSFKEGIKKTIEWVKKNKDL
jgi:nucleoside-diphosphate-sugar epimerase